MMTLFDFFILAQTTEQPNGTGFTLLQILIPIISTIITAILGWVGGSYAHKRTVAEKQVEKEINEADLFKILTDENKRCQDYNELLKTEIMNLKKFCDENRTELHQIQNEVFVMRQKLEFYEKNNLASDAREMLSKVLNANERPMWIHSLSSDSKWYLNDAYCSLFAIKRPNFWTPVNILARYPSEFCLQYIQEDLKVVHSNLSQVFEEIVKKDILNPVSTEMYVLKVRKTPLTINDNSYILGEVLSFEEK